MTTGKLHLSDPIVNEEAANWRLTISSEKVTAQELRAFEAWLARSPENERAFRRVEAFLATSDELKSRIAHEGGELATRLDHLIKKSYASLPHGGLTTNALYSRKSSWAPGWAPGRKWVIGGAGFAIAASIMIVSIFSIWFTPTPATNVFETATGQRVAVALADKSVIQLNTQSRVTVLYSASKRHIRLERGEAVFSVAKNPARPFIVETPAGSVTALGTVFGVRVQKEGTKVIVLEGVVRVNSKDKDAPSDTDQASGLASKLVHINQTAKIVKTVSPVATLSKDEIGRAVSWREGRLEYLAEPLNHVIEDLNRYRKDKIIIADSAIESMTIGGVFNTNNTDFVLFLLQNSYGVKVVHVTPYLTLLFKTT